MAKGQQSNKEKKKPKKEKPAAGAATGSMMKGQLTPISSKKKG